MEGDKLIMRTKDISGFIHLLMYSLLYAGGLTAVAVFIRACYLFLTVGAWWFYPFMLGISLVSAVLFYSKWDVLREIDRDGQLTARERRMKRRSAGMAITMFIFVILFIWLCVSGGYKAEM